MKHISHKYKEEELATVNKPGLILQTLSLPHEGPFKVIEQHDNGSITIECKLYKEENISLCCVYTYYRKHTNNESQQNDNT